MYGTNPQLSAFLANERRAQLLRTGGGRRRRRRPARGRTWVQTFFVR